MMEDSLECDGGVFAARSVGPNTCETKLPEIQIESFDSLNKEATANTNVFASSEFSIQDSKTIFILMDLYLISFSKIQYFFFQFQKPASSTPIKTTQQIPKHNNFPAYNKYPNVKPSQLQKVNIPGVNLLKYKCKVCSKVFDAKDKIFVHMQTEHPEHASKSKLINLWKKRNYVCGKCNKTFQFINMLWDHQTTHLDEDGFECSYEGCQKRFENERALATHLHWHRNEVCDSKGKVIGYMRKEKIDCPAKSTKISRTGQGGKDEYKLLGIR